MARFQGVLFDAGNTLIRVRSSVGEVYASVARRHGGDPDGAALEARFRSAFFGRKAGFIASVTGPHSPERERAWWRTLVEEVFRGAGYWQQMEGRFEAFFDELYRTFEGPEHWEVFPDVFPCLDTLAGLGVRLGVVSNWDSRLHAVFRGLGLAERFGFVLTSAEFGAEKPDPTIFWEGARRLGLAPQEILYVGDLHRDDLAGAASAGMAAVRVDRGCPEPRSAQIICSLAEVADRVG